MDDTERKRQEDSISLKEYFHGDIWTLAIDIIDHLQKLRARTEELQNSINSLRSDSKQKTLKSDVNSLCSLSPRESKLEEEIEADLPCLDDDFTQKRQRNEKDMDIESPALEENRQDSRMMLEEQESPYKPPLTRYEKPRKYKPKFKKIYRIKLPPTEDRRMHIEKEPSLIQEQRPNDRKKESRTRFKRIYFRIHRPKVLVKVYRPKDIQIEENWGMVSHAPAENALMMIEEQKTSEITTKKRRPSLERNAESGGSPPISSHTTKKKKFWSSKMTPDPGKQITLDRFVVKNKR